MLRFKTKTSDFEPIPAGNHVAICTGVCDLGLQRGNGKFEPREEVWIQFELPEQRFTYTKNYIKHEGTRSTGRRFRVSMDPKANLRKFIEPWQGHFPNDAAANSFELKSLLGKICMVQVVHTDGADGKVYANLDAALPVPVSLDVSTVKQTQPTLYYEIGVSDADALSALPDWLRKLVTCRLQDPPRAVVAPPPVAAGKPEFDDDIPF
jgi:hypothetical protein